MGYFKKILAWGMAAAILISGVGSSVGTVKAETTEVETEAAVYPTIPSTKSIAYVTAMGSGWNLGNTFDAYNANLDAKDKGETTWRNPVVTKELLHAVKEKGYDSIRMPFTIYRRYTVNENAGENEYKYVINTEWLARYKEVVDWAVEEGLYVVINIHHDSQIWLKYWDGNKESEEYRMYTDFWKQLAAYMADEPEQVSFETINEPTFEDNEAITVQDRVTMLNRSAYEIIRGTAGNEERMILLPTEYTEYAKSEPLYQLITELNDENVIATVHYYSEWFYSANLGVTSFDEELWKIDGESYTARTGADTMMETIYDYFTKHGIGVVVGEYGLSGFSSADDRHEIGESLKYYEYMNELARRYNVCLMFWDSGAGIDRKDTIDYSWKIEEVGRMLENSMEGRSSYATGLDNLYFSSEVTEDVKIPLTLNGNTFVGIEGLTEGVDYTYDSASATVTISKDYINGRYAAMTSYGTFATLVMKFSSGADWNEYLIKCAVPVLGNASGTTSEGIGIPVTFYGSRVRRITAYQASGRVGRNSNWWNYLKYNTDFSVDYENGTFYMLSKFFEHETVNEGLTQIRVEYYDGQVQYMRLDIAGELVTASPELVHETYDVDASKIICLYAGETEIPAQYLYMPEGASVYGTWADQTDGLITLEGYPRKMIFDTKAHDKFVFGGIVIKYFDIEETFNVKFGIKDAPVVSDTSIAGAGYKKNITVSNLAKDAKLTYACSDTSVATVDEKGCVTGKKAGEAVITVTVEQYNRTDAFTAKVVVGDRVADNSESDDNESGSGENESGSGDSGAADTGAADIGKIFTSGKYTYQVTGVSTVAFTGVKSKKTTKVTIPKTVKYKNKTYKVTSVAAKALYKNKKVTKVTIGANVKTVGADAFTGCTKLQKVSVKKGVTFIIGAYKYKTTGSKTIAFSGIKSAKTTKVTIADQVKIGAKSYKVTSIESKALYKKTKVTKVTIGANVKTIGKKAFYGCKKLGSVKVNTKVLKSVGTNAFKGTKASLNITVPSGKYGTYKKLFRKAGLSSKAKVVKK